MTERQILPPLGFKSRQPAQSYRTLSCQGERLVCDTTLYLSYKAYAYVTLVRYPPSYLTRLAVSKYPLRVSHKYTRRIR